MALKRINFVNKSEPYVSAQNLNALQDNIEQALGSSSGAPIGSGMDYYGTVAPEGYMFANGAAISRTEYSQLFAVIGTTYGAGDGSTTFNLPDKRSRVSVMLDISNSNFNSLGKKIGADTHKLTIAEMPKHRHTALVIDGTEDSNGSLLSGGGFDAGKQITQNTSYVGGDTPHNIIQKSFVCNYIIKVK